jgi:hypothetical protein
LRLWNGLPQREAHRELVGKWLASKCARDNPPPPVPRWVKSGEPIEESEERRMSRAMWRLSRGMVSQDVINGWPDRWRKVGRTQGFLNKDGTLRKFGGTA